MTYVTVLLPVGQGVAVYAALTRAADTTCDGRSRGQVMADTVVERVTGRAADQPVPVALNLVMADTTLFGEDDAPGWLENFGPVPAGLARALTGDAVADASAKAALRRLYRHPVSGQLVAMESRSRIFPKGLARVHRPARPDLPHPVLQCPDPASRPRRAETPGRATSAERSRYLRGLQLRRKLRGGSSPLTTPPASTPRSSPPRPVRCTDRRRHHCPGCRYAKTQPGRRQTQRRPGDLRGRLTPHVRACSCASARASAASTSARSMPRVSRAKSTADDGHDGGGGQIDRDRHPGARTAATGRPRSSAPPNRRRSP